MMKFLTREIVVLAALDWALLAGCAPVSHGARLAAQGLPRMGAMKRVS